MPCFLRKTITTTSAATATAVTPTTDPPTIAGKEFPLVGVGSEAEHVTST